MYVLCVCVYFYFLLKFGMEIDLILWIKEKAALVSWKTCTVPWVLVSVTVTEDACHSFEFNVFSRPNAQASNAPKKFSVNYEVNTCLKLFPVDTTNFNWTVKNESHNNTNFSHSLVWYLLLKLVIIKVALVAWSR